MKNLSLILTLFLILWAGNAIAQEDEGYETDGCNWISETPLPIFPPRWDHTAVVFNNKIWVLGGAPPAIYGTNDVWYRAVIEK